MYMQQSAQYEPQYIEIYSQATQPYILAKEPDSIPHFESQFIKSKLREHPSYQMTNKYLGGQHSIHAVVSQQLCSEVPQRMKYPDSWKGSSGRNKHLRNLSDPHRQFQSRKQVALDMHCLVEGKTISIQEQRETSRNSKRPITSAKSTRSDPLYRQDQFLRSVNFSQRKRPMTASTSERKVRPVTAENIKYIKKNPLVVYPFETKLKIKRVDDNPKVLEKVIARKSKTHQKKELYEFINRLIERRGNR